jgi:lipid-A-disaccharide synthase-like uncharacterized protein
MVGEVRTYWIFGLGFFAQAIFGLRIVVQWLHAEKKGQVVSPSLFWNLSLAGSTLFLVYGIIRHDLVIICGQLLSYFIYIRNIQLKKDWNSFPPWLRSILIAIPGLAILLLAISPPQNLFPQNLFQSSNIFFVLGIIGQALLNIRFIYQLYHSERHKQSILPAGFWWMSMAGSLLMITYSVYRLDPVLLLAQGLAIVPYVRNIVISKRASNQHV